MTVEAKACVSIVLLALFSDATGVAAAQTLRDRIREQGRSRPGVPLILPPVAPADLLPKTIEQVASEADAVVLATLFSKGSRLVADQFIATDFAVVVSRAVAGRVPVLPSATPGVTVPLILSVAGGEALVDGVVVRTKNGNLEPIKEGHQYLLFLRSARPDHRPGEYEIYDEAIFEIVDEAVRPLFKDAANIFTGTVDRRASDFVNRIERAGRSR
jgi:hypothetical protein